MMVCWVRVLPPACLQASLREAKLHFEAEAKAARAVLERVQHDESSIK